MTDSTRREFLLTTGTAVAAGAMLGQLPATVFGADDVTAQAPRSNVAPIPPHRELPVTGIHLYTDRHSYRAGDTLTAYVSASVPGDIEIVRLGDDLDSPKKDDVLQQLKIDKPAMQPVHPGSYIHVEKGLPAVPTGELTLECWIRLWSVHELQGVITQLDDANGFGLLVFPDGTLGFFSGECAIPAETPYRTKFQLGLPDTPTFNAFVTPPSTWHHVVAVGAYGHKTIWVDGRIVGQWGVGQSIAPAACPLRIGAFGQGGKAAGFLDADIAMPAIYSRPLTEEEIRTRYAERGLNPPALEPALLGCWPLAEERGEQIADVSGATRNGRLINHGTWMIGGPSFLPGIARYRRDYRPDDDAIRGHGLRLASDDLYHCRWQPTLKFSISKTARSGLYALRGRYASPEGELLTHAVFVVKRAAEAPPAKIALLYSTNTWKAYSGASFGPAWPGIFANVGNKGFQPKPNDPLAPYCFYRFHRAGQPTYQIGWQIPWPATSPYAIVSTPDVAYSHLSRADRFTQRWLEQNNYRFDALSDLDLHRDAHALDGVKVLYIVGHSEYWTREAMQRVREFLDRGGNVISLSGNTMYWRVTQSDDDAVLECRKADAWGAQLADYMRGECWHEHDHLRGGVPRDCGDPEWKTLGVEFVAANEMTVKSDGAFHVIDETHPFFQTPQPVGVTNGDRFAFDAVNKGRQPLGHESDVRVSTLMELTRRMPGLKGLLTDVQDPAGIRLLAVGRYASDGRLGAMRDYAHRVIPAALRKVEDSLCDVIHWQRPGGGQVFAAPSIAAGWTLGACPHWSTLMKNVLHHFGVEAEQTT